MNWGIIGHSWAVEMLRLSMRRGAIRHAYLLTGEEGLGKRTLASRFAKAMECQAPPEAGVFCGRCRACRLIENGTYPDLHFVSRSTEGGSVGIDEIRGLQSQLALAPYEGAWRIALLDRFQEATLSAQNALLKTLEEPPERVRILICARDEAELLPTVVSRCEHIPLRPLPVEEMRTALLELGESQAQADLLARLSGGRPGKALDYRSDPELLRRREERLVEHFQLLRCTRNERFQYVDAFLRGVSGRESPSLARSESMELISLWVGVWRDAMLCFYGQRESICNVDREGDLAKIQTALDVGSVVATLQAMEGTLEALGRNANTRLALETLMLDLPHI